MHFAGFDLRQPRDLLKQFKLIPPVQSCLQKHFGSAITQIRLINRAVPPLSRGAFRDRHGRWARDAMDAGGTLTNGVGCGRRSRVVLAPRRWR